MSSKGDSLHLLLWYHTAVNECPPHFWFSFLRWVKVYWNEHLPVSQDGIDTHE